MIRAKIKNPSTGASSWFFFPLYFGSLRVIGHSCSYNDPVEVLEVEGTDEFHTGTCSLDDLEMLNRIAEV